MNPTTPLWCAAVLVAACASITPPTAAESQQLEEARALMRSDLDAAASAAEAMLRQNRGLREARRGRDLGLERRQRGARAGLLALLVRGGVRAELGERLALAGAEH